MLACLQEGGHHIDGTIERHKSIEDNLQGQG